MFQLKLHELAHEEYITTYVWYELQQSGVGDKFRVSVEECLVKISTYPLHYSRLHGNYRKAKVSGFPFTIVYEYFEEHGIIHVSAIYHSSRDPRKKFRKER